MKNTYNKALYSIEQSIFMRISQLANQHQAINLSQGFPDFDYNMEIKNFIKESMDKSSQQYAHPYGVTELRNSIATMVQEIYGTSFDPNKEVLITAGATQAIFITILGLINPSDRVLVFSPFYDSYVASIRMANAIPVEYCLSYDNANPIDFEKLEETLSIHRPKIIIVNNPHNPTGICFSQEILSKLLYLANKFDAYILSDEVYEFLTYSQINHIPMHTIENKENSRIITISSAGKTFGYTGHKIGWILANQQIIEAIFKVHQYNMFSVCTPLQWAYAQVLKLDIFIPYIKDFKTLYEEKRNTMYEKLSSFGFTVLKPNGSYFMCMKVPDNIASYEYALELITKKKLAIIPVSSFYLEKNNEGDHWIRLCFAKKNETIQSGVERLSH